MPRNKSIISKIILLFSMLFLLTNSISFAQSKKDKKNAELKGQLSEEQKNNLSVFYFEGLKQKSLGEIDFAIINFNKVIALDPNNAAAFYELGQLYISKKKTKDAEIAFNEAIKIEPNNEWYLSALAEVEEKQNNYKAAEETYSKIIKLKPEKSEFYFDLASMQLYQGKFKEALQTYYLIEKQIGINEDVIIQKEKIWLKLNKVDKAVLEVQKLIKYNPKETRYKLMLAELYLANNLSEKALNTYLDILKEEPTNGYAQLALADYYREKKDAQRSMEFLQLAFANPAINIDNKVRILSPYFSVMSVEAMKEQALILAKLLPEAHPTDAKAFAIYGDFLYQDKQLEKAKGLYQETIKLDKKVFAVWQNLLFIEAETSDYKSLLETSEEAKSLFPTQSLVFYMNAAAKMQLKDYTHAIESYQIALSVLVDNKELEAQIYANLGDAYHNLKEESKSDSSYEKVLKLKPEEAFVLNNYAYYLSLRGINLERAEQMSLKSNELQKDNSNFQDTYAWILYKLNKYEDALVWIQKAAQTGEGKSATVLEHYGDILFKLGKKQDAMEKWKAAKVIGDASPLIEKKIQDQKLYE